VRRLAGKILPLLLIIAGVLAPFALMPLSKYGPVGSALIVIGCLLGGTALSVLAARHLGTEPPPKALER
jgi:hypothetical protein